MSIIAKPKHGGSKSVCAVCRHLDPHLADDYFPPKFEWAAEEFRSSKPIHSATVSVDDSDELVRSAPRGCAYCRLVCDALTSLRPGWNCRETSLALMLGAYLPVVLRLTPGTKLRAPVALKVEGVTHRTQVGVRRVIDEQPEEFEIYRPWEPRPFSWVSGVYCILSIWCPRACLRSTSSPLSLRFSRRSVKGR